MDGAAEAAMALEATAAEMVGSEAADAAAAGPMCRGPGR